MRPNASPFVKDGIGRCVVDGDATRVNPAMTGTKAAAHYPLVIAAGATESVVLRLAKGEPRLVAREAPDILDARRAEVR